MGRGATEKGSEIGGGVGVRGKMDRGSGRAETIQSGGKYSPCPLRLMLAGAEVERSSLTTSILPGRYNCFASPDDGDGSLPCIM